MAGIAILDKRRHSLQLMTLLVVVVMLVVAGREDASRFAYLNSFFILLLFVIASIIAIDATYSTVA
jgi:hypothetical protein